MQKTYFKIPWLFSDPFWNSLTVNYPSYISYICVQIFQCAFYISNFKEHFLENIYNTNYRYDPHWLWRIVPTWENIGLLSP